MDIIALQNRFYRSIDLFDTVIGFCMQLCRICYNLVCYLRHNAANSNLLWLCSKCSFIQLDQRSFTRFLSIIKHPFEIRSPVQLLPLWHWEKWIKVRNKLKSFVTYPNEFLQIIASSSCQNYWETFRCQIIINHLIIYYHLMDNTNGHCHFCKHPTTTSNPAPCVHRYPGKQVW